MNKRRSSEDKVSPTANRKKLSTQFLTRLKPSLEIFTSAIGAKPDIRSVRESPTPSSALISNVIQSKVANLKQKFGQLDNMRKKLIESCCDNREETESKLSTLNRTRPLSTDSYTESLFSDFPVKNLSFSIEKLEEELHNERKSTQKAILEKNLAEREGQEKINSLQKTVNSLNKEVERLSKVLKCTEKKLNDCETVRIEQEGVIRGLEEDRRKLNQEVVERDYKVKKLSKDVRGLEKELGLVKEGLSVGTVKNLSNIILSSSVLSNNNSPKKETSQILNSYLTCLQDLISADQFSLHIIQELEKNNLSKAQKSMLNAKTEITSRLNKANSTLLDHEKPLENLKSFNSINRSLLNPSPQPIPTQEDFLNWIKCQAATIEELLIISN